MTGGGFYATALFLKLFLCLRFLYSVSAKLGSEGVKNGVLTKSFSPRHPRSAIRILGCGNTFELFVYLFDGMTIIWVSRQGGGAEDNPAVLGGDLCTKLIELVCLAFGNTLVRPLRL